MPADESGAIDLTSIAGATMKLRDGGPLLGVDRMFMIWACPACDWQVDVSSLVVGRDYQANKTLFDHDLEEVLREHVAHECPHPRLIEALWRDRGSPTA